MRGKPRDENIIGQTEDNAEYIQCWKALKMVYLEFSSEGNTQYRPFKSLNGQRG